MTNDNLPTVSRRSFLVSTSVALLSELSLVRETNSNQT